jgi:hypothetical protein
VAEHQVRSCLHSHNSYTEDFVSHHTLLGADADSDGLPRSVEGITTKTRCRKTAIHLWDRSVDHAFQGPLG